MKKAAALISVLNVLCLCGCTVTLPEITTAHEDGQEFQTTEIVIEITEEYTTFAEATTALQEETSGSVETTVEETTVETTAEMTTQEITTAVPDTTVAASTTQVTTEVDLSVSMPEKNGTMETDASADNKYIKIVCNKKKIDARLLYAVYAVPESGQNYVFEFYSADKFTADNIRRVYLIDSEGNISGVAAVKSTERENVSAVENWFCMNVLIKEIIFPAVSGDIS